MDVHNLDHRDARPPHPLTDARVPPPLPGVPGRGVRRSASLQRMGGVGRRADLTQSLPLWPESVGDDNRKVTDEQRSRGDDLELDKVHAAISLYVKSRAA